MSLRKVSSAHIEKTGFWIFATWRFFTTKNKFFNLTNGAYQAAKDRLESSGAARIANEGQRTLWWTNGGLFWADSDLTDNDVGLLLWDRQRRHDSKFERLRQLRARETEAVKARRERIPNEVKSFVWERDDGRCVNCSAVEDLQFDHVIPITKGGGNSIDNIQILCGDCNRQKSDSII